MQLATQRRFKLPFTREIASCNTSSLQNNLTAGHTTTCICLQFDRSRQYLFTQICVASCKKKLPRVTWPLAVVYFIKQLPNVKMNIRAQLKILIWKAITPRSSITKSYIHFKIALFARKIVSYEIPNTGFPCRTLWSKHFIFRLSKS